MREDNVFSLSVNRVGLGGLLRSCRGTFLLFSNLQGISKNVISRVHPSSLQKPYLTNNLIYCSNELCACSSDQPQPPDPTQNDHVLLFALRKTWPKTSSHTYIPSSSSLEKSRICDLFMCYNARTVACEFLFLSCQAILHIFVQTVKTA